MLIDFSSKLSRIIVICVNWAKLGPNSDWPVQLTLNLTNFYEIFLTLHLSKQVLLLGKNDDVLEYFGEFSAVD